MMMGMMRMMMRMMRMTTTSTPTPPLLPLLRARRHIARNVVAALADTAFTGKGKGAAGSTRHIERRLRRDQADTLQPDLRERTESSRWEWAVYESYEQWFEGWKSFSLEKGYAVVEAEYDSDGAKIADIRFPEEKKQRIITIDETEIPLDSSKRCGRHNVNRVLINPAGCWSRHDPCCDSR